MKHLHQIILTLALLVLAVSSSAVTLIDDTWTDGSRNEQNPPTESAWFTDFPERMTTGVGYLSATNRDTQSSQWTTYFTAPGYVSQLGVGDTLTATWEFTPLGVPTATNSSQTFKVALCNSSAGTRVASDVSPNAAYYTGYGLLCRFSPTWSGNTGLDLRKRASGSLGNGGLQVASGDWFDFGSGGSATGTQGFTNGGQYTLTISITRTALNTNSLTVSFSGGGLTNSLTVVDTNGVSSQNILTNFDSMQIRPSAASSTATNFVFTRFKVIGPAAAPVPALIVSSPTSRTLTVGETATFGVGAGGAPPLSYQWYFNDTTPVVGGTNATLLLTNIQTSQAGGYSVIVTNSLGAATSTVATLTVNLPAYTGLGVVVDDTWQDGDRIAGPVTSTNAIWLASANATLTATVGSMLGASQTNTSTLWVGYFTDNASTPVDINVGQAIKATLVFTPTNVAPQNTSSMRFGLFNYTESARVGDNFGSGSAGNGTNVTGYMLQQNFATTLGDDAPMEIHARNNLTSVDLMGNTGDYLSLGAGPAGSSNAPGFVSGTQYTLELTVARTDPSSVAVVTRITGGSLNLQLVETDRTYAYRRFDAFAMRANRTSDSAETFNITEFKVQVIPASVPFRITSIERQSAAAAKLTWDSIASKVYQVQSRDALGSGNWVTNGTVTAAGSITSFTNSGLSDISQRYYRIVNTP